jgi:hypothetical protein
MYRTLIAASVAKRGEFAGVAAAKKHVGVLGPLVPAIRPRLIRANDLAQALDALA